MVISKSREQLLFQVSAQIRECVLEAARYLDAAARSGEAPTVEMKADKTLVMNLDLESQRIIMSRLSGSYPIVAEEDPSSHSRIEHNDTYFLVDPLDGTTSCKRFLGQQGGQVGYGPLVGFVHGGELAVAAFYSVPHRQLFTAILGQGTFVTTFSDDWTTVVSEQKLLAAPCAGLQQAGMLFFISHYGEASVVEFLRKSNAVENIYRFGGFASDCARLAQSFEQIQLQFAAKPWDFSAVLLAAEAGCEVFCDPLNRRVPLRQWRIEPNNPIVTLPAGRSQEFFALLDMMKRE
jgi:myo-inositol-1(or 4)-monophosphatase